METARSFLAIELGSHFQDEVSSVINTLKPERAKIKWVKPAIAHVTLHFFGNITLDQIETVKKCVYEVVRASGHSPLQLGLDRVGTFPSPHKARVVWIGLKGDVEPLVAIKTEIDKNIKNVGAGPCTRPDNVKGAHGGAPLQTDDKKFHPHLTIGRVKDLKHDQDFIQKLQLCSFHSEKKATINEIILFKSDLKPEGPVYTALEKFPL